MYSVQWTLYTVQCNALYCWTTVYSAAYWCTSMCTMSVYSADYVCTVNNVQCTMVCISHAQCTMICISHVQCTMVCISHVQCTMVCMSHVQCTMVCISQSPSMAHPAIHCWRAGNYHCRVQTKQPVHNTLYTSTLHFYCFQWCLLVFGVNWKLNLGKTIFRYSVYISLTQASCCNKKRCQLALVYLNFPSNCSQHWTMLLSDLKSLFNMQLF